MRSLTSIPIDCQVRQSLRHILHPRFQRREMDWPNPSCFSIARRADYHPQRYSSGKVEMRCERIIAMFECHALWTSQRHCTTAKSLASTFSLPKLLLHRKETMGCKLRRGEWASKSLKAMHHLDCWFDCASMTAASRFSWLLPFSKK
jgi:hypothetical protein